jgi:hypothetical protein
MKTFSFLVAVLLLLIVIVGGGALFTVSQTEQAIVLRLGEPVAGRGLRDIGADRACPFRVAVGRSPGTTEPSMSKRAFVQLATENEDLGIVQAGDALGVAQEFANEQGVAVTLRDPVSDELLATIQPAARARSAAR